MKNIAIIDQAKGIGILIVFICHFGQMNLEVISFGYLAVIFSAGWSMIDLFFVFSGMFITTILLKTRERSDYFKRFWIRRSLKIMPIYYISLISILLIGYLFYQNSPGFEQIFSNQAFFWVYLQNFWFASNGWTEFLHVAPFWSLAIEEQYYLTWPFVVFMVPRRFLPGFIILCFIAVIALRTYLALNGASSIFLYTFTLTKCDGLLLGSLAALIIIDHRQWIKYLPYPAAICLALLFCIAVWKRGLFSIDVTVQVLATPLFAIFFMCIAVLGIEYKPDGYKYGSLLAKVGMLTYPVYLFHYAVLLFLRDLAGLTGFQLLLAFPVTFLLAYLSVAIIEKPLLIYKNRLAPLPANVNLLHRKRSEAATR